MDEKEKHLLDFLLDIQCLDSLKKWSETFNLFDILKIAEKEICHSNMLAWLLQPNGNHGLGNAVLQQLLQTLITNFGADSKVIFDALLMNLDHFEILREYNYIDIFAISHEGNFVICIENKIFSGEHDDQLSKYYTFVQERYPDYTARFVYLTPDGHIPEKPEDQEHWQPLSYAQIIVMIEKAMAGKTINPDVKMVIQHYIDAIRRHIMDDKELESRCKGIYQKHKDALDLIFEYRNNRIKTAAEGIKEWCRKKAQQDEIEFDEVSAAGRIGEVSFTTPFMTALLPGFEERKSGWKDKCIYHYTIYNRKGGEAFSPVLILAGKNLDEAQQKCCRDVCALMDGKQREPGWQWWTLKSWNDFSIDNNLLMEEEYRISLFEKLDQVLEEIKRFEEGLKKKLSLSL